MGQPDGFLVEANDELSLDIFREVVTGNEFGPPLAQWVSRDGLRDRYTLTEHGQERSNELADYVGAAQVRMVEAE